MERTNYADKIIIHCSDSSFGDAETIRKWHTEPPRNWDDIGYHYIINLDGTIEAGRNIFIQAAHCRGQNKKSIGVCLIGRGEQDFTDIQMSTLKEFVRLLCKTQGIATHSIFGHYHFSSKTCPNFDVEEFRKFV